MSLSNSLGSSAGSAPSRPKVNLRSTAVKRIMQEAAELAREDTMEEDFVAAPLESDIFEWHCTMRGVAGSEYEGGIYHFRIVLPASYPMSPPDILLLTPNGRFELSKKICIDGLTSFHVGSWQPAWGVRTAILGLRSFWMQQQGEALAAVGAMNCEEGERRRLAVLSREWKCPTCQQSNKDILPDRLRSAAGQASASNAVDSKHSQPDHDEGQTGKDLVSDTLPLARPDQPHTGRVAIDSHAVAAAGSSSIALVDSRAGGQDARHESRPPFSKIPLKSRSEPMTTDDGIFGGAVSGASRPAPNLLQPNDAQGIWKASSQTTTFPGPDAFHSEPPSIPGQETGSSQSPRILARPPRDANAAPPHATSPSPPNLIRPSTAIPHQSSAVRGRPTPFWLDAAIVGLGALVVALLARRLYLGDPDLDGALRASLTDL